jgi:thiosulfate/3-mercaptopyruvate sulfurtransferase
MSPAPTELPASSWLVTTEWLADRLDRRNIVAVDGSYYLPTERRNAKSEYLTGHIPGAVFFDIEVVADRSSGLPHMLPTPEIFAEAVGALGIGNDDTVVVYDGVGLFSAARVWWTFRALGAEHVFILDGGMPKWIAERRRVEAGSVAREPRHFSARLDPSAVASLADVRAALAAGSAQVVDARSAARFRGEEPEPRPDVRRGHIPGALNVPYAGLIASGRLLPPERLAAAFAAGDVDIEKPIITSCGSGVTAAILWLALDTLGKKPAGLYDGSWVEWGSRHDLPIAIGPK